MTLPILGFTHGCWGACDPCLHKIDERCGSLSVVTISAILDLCLLITSLAVGILGALGAITMPAAASYALIGVGIGILALWAIYSIHCKTRSKVDIKKDQEMVDLSLNQKKQKDTISGQ